MKGEGGGDREEGDWEGGGERERESTPTHSPPHPPLSTGFTGVKGGRRFKRSLLYNVAGWGGGEILKPFGNKTLF